MHLRVARDPFVKALGSIQGVASGRQSLPVLSHVLLEAAPGDSTLFGTDLDVGLRTTLMAEVEQAGAVLLPAKKLHEIVRELPSAPIEIQMGEDLHVTLACERSRFRLRGLPREDFPMMPALTTEGIVLDASLYGDLFRKVRFAISADQTRYTLTGVLVRVQPTTIEMVATDGHKLARVQATLPDTAGHATFEALVPRKAMEVAHKAMTDETIMVALHETQVLFHQPDTLLAARLLDGQFPNYQGVIPTPGPTIQVDREALVGALRRTSTLTDRVVPTTFCFDGTTLALSCQNPDLGEAHETLELPEPAPQVQLGFNAQYVLDFLGAVDTDRITIQVQDALAPAVFRALGDDHYACVIMPMRF